MAKKTRKTTTTRSTKSKAVSKKKKIVTRRKKKDLPDEGTGAPDKPIDCKELQVQVNQSLQSLNESLINSMDNCDPKAGSCSCTGGEDNNKGKMIDLIVLIDTSGSMDTHADNISAAVSSALTMAKKNCTPNLSITYLGVNGITGDQSTSLFTESHLVDIFNSQGSVLLSSTTNPYNTTNVDETTEWGANAIEDLSLHHNWRKKACKAIFYISDTRLNGDGSPIADENFVVSNAIQVANSQGISVFAHLIKPTTPINANYEALCTSTGGSLYQEPSANVKRYSQILSQIICNACGVNKCKKLDIPEVKPCISIKWGASDCDCIESSDTEVMTITVCNCYSNISFSNFNIAMLEVTDSEGNPVPALPNGTPSVKLHPKGVYCFGDIAPCSCVSREFVMINEGAKDGKYIVNLKGICFEIVIPSVKNESCFEFEICKD